MDLKNKLFAHGAIRLLTLIHNSASWNLVGCSLKQLEDQLAQPTIVLFWHNQLLSFSMVPLILPRKMVAPSQLLSNRLYMLTSAHRDGQLIAYTIQHLGLNTVTGSSSKGGTTAFRQMLALLKLGHSIGITPDGPRGPKEQVKKGAVKLAMHSGAPILPCAISASKAWHFSSWDNMFLAKPFSKISMAVGEPLYLNASMPLNEALVKTQKALDLTNQVARVF